MEKENVITLPGWKIVRVIGRGSFGTVYEIEKENQFGESVRSALKVISIPETDAEIKLYRDEGYDDISITAIFRSQVEDITKEFEVMNRLKGNSNIVSFEDHAIVQHENDPGYDVLIRMELLRSMPDYINQRNPGQPIPDGVVIKLGIDLSRALELCEKCRIIHRDIKPQNIFINDLGEFKLGDFGIAKTSDHTTKATKTGTYGYMAPEVYTGKAYNAQVDIYSLGLVMYWMLNERRGPFLPLPPAVPKPSQNSEALERRMSGEALPAPKHGSEELKRIVLKACAFDPKDRYASPTEMKRDLLALTDVTTQFAITPLVEKHDPAASMQPEAADEKTVGIFWDRTAAAPPMVTEANPNQTPRTETKPSVSEWKPSSQPRPPKPETEAESKPIEKPKDSAGTTADQTKPKQTEQPATPTPTSMVNPVVVFQNVTFEKVIREKCGFTGTIYQSDVLSVTDLDLSGCELTDISDIAQFRNLYYLNLGWFWNTNNIVHRNYISDITALSGLTNLQQLYLDSNQISDITALSDLTSLQHLYLSDNQISDITALSGLTKLETLWLHRNQISGITSLSDLTNLRYLGLNHNQISDTTVLSGLTKLEMLWLLCNQISDISALSGLTELKGLYLSDNQISDISALSGLTKLQSLDLYGNPLSKRQINVLKTKLPNCAVTDR